MMCLRWCYGHHFCKYGVVVLLSGQVLMWVVEPAADKAEVSREPDNRPSKNPVLLHSKQFCFKS